MIILGSTKFESALIMSPTQWHSIKPQLIPFNPMPKSGPSLSHLSLSVHLAHSFQVGSVDIKVNSHQKSYQSSSHDRVWGFSLETNKWQWCRICDAELIPWWIVWPGSTIRKTKLGRINLTKDSNGQLLLLLFNLFKTLICLKAQNDPWSFIDYLRIV